MEERLKETDLISLLKGKLRNDITSVYNCLKDYYRRNSAKFFFQLTNLRKQLPQFTAQGVQAGYQKTKST